MRSAGASTSQETPASLARPAAFAITEPPLKLVLMEHSGQAGGLNHLGIEVSDIDAVHAEQTRLAEAGLGPAGTAERSLAIASGKAGR